MTFRVVAAADHAWDEAFARLPVERRDVFYGPGYARLCQETMNRADQVLCAIADTASGPILYPFAMRELARIVGAPGDGLRDMVGLYGRNGIACSPDVAHDDLSNFHSALAFFAKDNQVICSFDRYHPVWRNERFAAPDALVHDVGRFVVVDMNDGIDAIERRYKSSVRKDLKKADRLGVTTFVETNCSHLDNFFAIYTHTMQRNRATAFYYHPQRFFELVSKLMADDALFTYAAKEGRIVSCELALLHGHYGHSFLGGTLQDALPSAANSMLKRDLMRALWDRGCRYFLLGGGSEPGDRIETYKRSYAPDGVLPSRIGGRVFNGPAMAALREGMQAAGMPISESRFQFYDTGDTP